MDGVEKSHPLLRRLGFNSLLWFGAALTIVIPASLAIAIDYAFGGSDDASAWEVAFGYPYLVAFYALAVAVLFFPLAALPLFAIVELVGRWVDPPVVRVVLLVAAAGTAVIVATAAQEPLIAAALTVPLFVIVRYLRFPGSRPDAELPAG
jgi:hypothetical protein